jgi:hypothetical protein
MCYIVLARSPAAPQVGRHLPFVPLVPLMLVPLCTNLRVPLGSSGEDEPSRGGPFILSENNVSDFLFVQDHRDYLCETLNKYMVLEDNGCSSWKGRSRPQSGIRAKYARTPIVKFGPFRKYGKTVTYVGWCLTYGKDVPEDSVIANTCSNTFVCVDPEHLVCVPRKMLTLFVRAKKGGVPYSQLIDTRTGFVKEDLEDIYYTAKSVR